MKVFLIGPFIDAGSNTTWRLRTCFFFPTDPLAPPPPPYGPASPWLVVPSWAGCTEAAGCRVRLVAGSCPEKGLNSGWERAFWF